jgi:hypothetical protein
MQKPRFYPVEIEKPLGKTPLSPQSKKNAARQNPNRILNSKPNHYALAWMTSSRTTSSNTFS